MSIRRTYRGTPTMQIGRIRLRTSAPLSEVQAHRLATLLGASIAGRELSSRRIDRLSIRVRASTEQGADGDRLGDLADAVATTVAHSITARAVAGLAPTVMDA